MVGDNAIDDRQPQPRAPFFRREIRQKQFIAVLVGNPHTRITHVDAYPLMAHVQGSDDLHTPFPVHSLEGVFDEVNERPLHLFTVQIDLRDRWITGEGDFDLAVHPPSGKFLFVAAGAGGVNTYSIDAAGALAFVGQAAVGGASSVAVDPSGKFVYAANGGEVFAFTFDSTTGALTPVPGSPFPAGATPGSVAVHPSGKFLYATNGNGQSVSAYTIDSTTGALTPIPGSPFAVGMIPLAMAFNPAGNFTYVANQISNNISAFTVDLTTGALLPVAGSPFPAGNAPLLPRVDPLGKFLYVVNQSDNDVLMFAIDATSGVLTNLGPVPAGLVPLSMVLVK